MCLHHSTCVARHGAGVVQQGDVIVVALSKLLQSAHPGTLSVFRSIRPPDCVIHPSAPPPTPIRRLPP